jgi:hypothetical protein
VELCEGWSHVCPLIFGPRSYNVSSVLRHLGPGSPPKELTPNPEHSAQGAHLWVFLYYDPRAAKIAAGTKNAAGLSKSRETTGNRRMNNIGFQLFLVILTSPRRFWCPRRFWQHWDRSLKCPQRVPKYTQRGDRKWSKGAGI